LQTSINDPRIPAITSITRVEVSPDFALAKVYVSVYAPEKKRDLCLQALRSSAGHLRYLLGQELTLRKTPTLDFRLDDSLRRGFETVQLIDEVMAQSRASEGETEGAEELDAEEAPEATAGDTAAAGDEGAREDT